MGSLYNYKLFTDLKFNTGITYSVTVTVVDPLSINLDCKRLILHLVKLTYLKVTCKDAKLEHNY